MTLLVGIEMSFFSVSRFFDLLFGVEIFFDFQLTGCRGPKKHAQVDCTKKTIEMLNNRMQNLDTKKRSRYQKGDLGHIDTTKKTSRYQKKMHPYSSWGARQKRPRKGKITLEMSILWLFERVVSEAQPPLQCNWRCYFVRRPL